MVGQTVHVFQLLGTIEVALTIGFFYFDCIIGVSLLV